MTRALRSLKTHCTAPAATPGTELIDWRDDTLVDLMLSRAAETPDLVLYTYLEDGEAREISMNAAELAAAARRIGQALARLAEPGARVVLLFEDGLDTIAGLFACLSAGLVAVSGIHPAAPRSSERLVGILRDCGATIILGQAQVLADFQRMLDEALDDFDLRWVASDRIRPGPAEAWAGTPSRNDGLALIQYTSGSSRAPRGVMLTHRNILHNLEGQAKAFGYQAGDTGVSWLPFSHDMGLIGCVLMAIYGGGRCVLLAPAHFLEDPLRWLRAIARYQATLSGGPNFAYDLCARRAEGTDLATLDLSAWAVAVNGAEPVRAEVLRRFAQTFAPAGFRAAALRPSYGLAEATLLVTCGARLAPLVTRHLDSAALARNLAQEIEAGGTELVGCGRGLPGQSIVIVDPQSLTQLGPGAIGEIWVAGPSISAGYFDRPQDNAAYFAGDLGNGRGPYLRTGDLGFVMDDELFVTGRLRDLLVIRGKNYYPQDFEHRAEASHKAVRPGSSACFLEEDSGELVVLAELMRGTHEEAPAAAAAIRAALISHHGISPRRVLLGAAGSVLKTPSGKIQRAQTRTALGQGLIALLHDSTVAEPLRAPHGAAPHGAAPQDGAQQGAVPLARLGPVDLARIEDWFLGRMSQMGVDVAALDPGMKLAELGFDSLKIVELKADLERELGILVPVADLYAFEDIRALAGHLRQMVLTAADDGAEPPQPIAAKPAARLPNRLAEQRLARGAALALPGGPVSL